MLHRGDRPGTPATPGGAGEGKLPARAGSAPGFTDEAGAIEAAPAGAAPDPALLARAREIAARLSLPRPPRQAAARRGSGELMSVPWRGSGDEIDLDACAETLLGNPRPRDEDIVVREYVRHRRTVVLLVDVSGSMRGERIRTAAATVGALAGELANERLAVVAFGSDATVLARFGDPIEAPQLVSALLRIPARGLTNVEFPLRVAHDQLARSPLRESRVLLLSDCVHNAGPDPRHAASALARLDVLVDTSDEHDLDLARDLARLGHGRVAPVASYRAVAPAISRFFAS
ncbi:MAG: vWA domain-containing protein [Sporichthyaceae bacterium]